MVRMAGRGRRERKCVCGWGRGRGMNVRMEWGLWKDGWRMRRRVEDCGRQRKRRECMGGRGSRKVWMT